MLGVFCRKWKNKRGSSGRKHKEKGDSREGTESQGDPIDQRDKGNKASHQVHPENQTVEKMNTMVATDTSCSDNKSELDWQLIKDKDSSRDSFWSTGSIKVRDNNSSPSPLPPYQKSEEIVAIPTVERIAEPSATHHKDVVGQMVQSSAVDRDLVSLHLANSNKHFPRDGVASVKNQNTIANIAALSAENSRRKCKEVCEESDAEKRDTIKECLEKKVLELERCLEEERSRAQHERRLLADHQKEQERNHRRINEVSHHDELVHEKSLRQATEARCKEVEAEKETFKAQIACLKEEIRKKELVMRNMVQFQSRLEQMSQEKSTAHSAYERKLRDCQLNIAQLEKVNAMLVNEIKNLEGMVTSFTQGNSQAPENREFGINKVLLERLKYLEVENSSLVLENEQQRMQYEKCLDDVANQVVQALLVQKGLQEECKKLKKRVSDLEQQNQTLHILFQQQLHKALDSRFHSESSACVYTSANTAGSFNSLPLASRHCQLEKMFTSTPSSTATGSITGSRSPVIRNSPSDSSVSSDSSTSAPPLVRCNQQHSWPMSNSSRKKSRDRPSSSSSSSPALHRHASQCEAVSRRTHHGGHCVKEVGFKDEENVCWRGSCLSCKEDECSRMDCCSSCSCGATYGNMSLQDERDRAVLLARRERRQVPHGLVMGMTDLLRLSHRKTTGTQSWHPDYKRTNKAASVGPSYGDFEFEMGLDSMTTPSDDGGCLKSFGVSMPNPLLALPQAVPFPSQKLTRSLTEGGRSGSLRSRTGSLGLQISPTVKCSPTSNQQQQPLRDSSFSASMTSPCEMVNKVNLCHCHVKPMKSSEGAAAGSEDGLLASRSWSAFCNGCIIRPVKIISESLKKNEICTSKGIWNSPSNVATSDEPLLLKKAHIGVPSDEKSLKLIPLISNSENVLVKKQNASEVKTTVATALDCKSTLTESLSGAMSQKCGIGSVGDESGIESVESSPKETTMSTSVIDDRDETTSKTSTSGSKDEGYSTMSSDVQCDGEAGEENSRRASISTSPEFFTFEVVEMKNQNSLTSNKNNNPELRVTKSCDKTEKNGEPNNLEDIFQMSCNTVIRCPHSGLASSKASSRAPDHVCASSLYSAPVESKPTFSALKPSSSAVAVNVVKGMTGKFETLTKETVAPLPHKNTFDSGTSFGSLSLLNVKAGHVESIKEKFELDNRKVVKLRNATDKVSTGKACLCSNSISVRQTSPEFGTKQLRVMTESDVDMLFMPIYCHLPGADGTPLSSENKSVTDFSNLGPLHRSKSDSCLYSYSDAMEESVFRSLHFKKKLLPCGPFTCWNNSAWDLTESLLVKDNFMGLHRSKGCLSLTEDGDRQNLLTSPFEMPALGWPMHYSNTSLNSLHSLCSGSGEASFIHESATSNKCSPEGSSVVSSDGDEDGSNEDAWFMVENTDCNQDFSTSESQGPVSYNDEEICNWSLNFSSEDICFLQPREDLAWEQPVNSCTARAPPIFGSVLRSNPSSSLPSIQEVEDDGDSYFSLPANSFMNQSPRDRNHRKLKEDLTRKSRRKDGACNSWPSTTDHCKGRCRTGRMGYPMLGQILQESESVGSWGSSMKCASEGLSHGNSKDLSQSSIDVEEFRGGRSSSEFASTQTSKSSVNLDLSNAQSVHASEDGETSPVEIHFKRDFYRLCKIESCRSLDVSCRNLELMDPTTGGSENASVAPDGARGTSRTRTDLQSDANVETPDSKVLEYVAGTDRVEDLQKSRDFGVMKGDERSNPDATVEDLPSDPVTGGEVVVDGQITVQETLQELNHMFGDIGEGSDDENCFELRESAGHGDAVTSSDGTVVGKEGCTTSWVHFEADVDLSDPKARANLLDSMLASSTSSSDTEVDSDTADDDYKYQHLHEIHRVRRFKKAADREHCIVRYIPPPRPSILDRKDFYYRYGEKEQEAVASFDFLEAMSTSVSDVGSAEILNEKGCSKADGRNVKLGEKEDSLSENGRTLSSSSDENKTCGSSHSQGNDSYSECRQHVDDGNALYRDLGAEMKLSALTLTSHEGDLDERLSLSDSCAESFSCSSSNLNLEI